MAQNNKELKGQGHMSRSLICSISTASAIAE